MVEIPILLIDKLHCFTQMCIFKRRGRLVRYEAPEMEILYLEAEDVITLSALTDSNGNNELTEHESDAGTGWD